MVSSPGRELNDLSMGGIATCAIPMEREISPLRDLRSLWALWRLFRRLRPDIVNAGTPKAGLLGVLAAKVAGVPCVVYTLRGLRLETTSGWKHRLLMLTERTACGLADRVRCVSRSLCETAVRLGIVADNKTCVIANGTSNGIDVRRYLPSDTGDIAVADLRSSLGIPAGARVLGFVGRFTRDKGVAELYESFQALKKQVLDLKLLMVGDFESGDPVDPGLRSAIESDPGVVRTGFVQDVAPFYALMDVLAFPSHREGFPGVPLEAQAAGVPVVVSDATGAVDSAVDGVTGLVVPVGNGDRLRVAIRKLLENPSLRAEMGSAGKEWVARNFSRETVWEALLEDYSRISRVSAHRETNWMSFAKSSMDRVFSFMVLLCGLPVWSVIAALIRADLGTPVFFRHTRPGLGGKPFTLYKFRTMSNARNPNGDLLPDAQRLTKFGRVLRALSLDEIPQLWNVLRGEMSLVGPRPLLMEYLDRYTPEQARRHEVLPGITGWAQVNGRNAISWPQKFKYDVWYVDHWSMWLDIRILFLTVSKVLCRKDISSKNHATMPEFLGTVRQESQPGSQSLSTRLM